LIHFPYSEKRAKIVQDALHAIKTVCDGQNPHIIHVESTGLFNMAPLFFIDMEIAEFSLHDYIYSTANLDVAPPASIKNLRRRFLTSKSACTWDIMRQATSALKFIHANSEVHRSIKASNSLHLLFPLNI